MILIWNRREIFIGNSMSKFNSIRQLLASKQIKYSYKVVNCSSRGTFTSNRSRFGNVGENPDYAYQYYIYVHKADYDHACSVLNEYS